MEKISTSVLLFGVFALQLFAAPDPVYKADPIYSKLKSFRTYFAVESYKGPRHSFLIWFKDDRGTGLRARMNVDTEKEALEAKVEGESGDDGYLVGSYNVPKDLPYSEVPKNLTGLAQAIEKRLRTLVAGSSDFVIRYRGRYSSFDLAEIIPLEDSSDAMDRRGHRTLYRVMLAEKGSHLEEDWGRSEGHAFKLCDPGRPDCEQMPEFISYSLPKEIESTSLLGSRFSFAADATKEYKDAFKNFEKEVVKTLAAKDAKKYSNPISKILAAQGRSVLPAGFNQRLNLFLTCEGYTKSKFVRRYLNVQVTANELMTKGFRKSYPVPELGITAEVKVHASKWLEVIVQQNGNKKTESMILSFAPSPLDVVTETGNHAIKRSLDLTFAGVKSAQGELLIKSTVPGFDSFRVTSSQSLDAAKVNYPVH